jgi:hypothetical protein
VSRNRDQLAGIHIQAGLKETDDGGYAGFCTVFATAADGWRMLGQLDPAEVRKMALNFLAGAEAAVQDAVVMNMLTRDVELEPGRAAAFVTMMRDERHRLDPDPDDEAQQ